ncbi:hypothetical protein [Pleurocapsa sp. PCC 7319]|nr:hypothetical protein [Pleurocapsa sp. PCC 7319]
MKNDRKLLYFQTAIAYSKMRIHRFGACVTNYIFFFHLPVVR